MMEVCSERLKKLLKQSELVTFISHRNNDLKSKKRKIVFKNSLRLDLLKNFKSTILTEKCCTGTPWYGWRQKKPRSPYNYQRIQQKYNTDKGINYLWNRLTVIFFLFLYACPSLSETVFHPFFEEMLVFPNTCNFKKFNVRTLRGRCLLKKGNLVYAKSK